MVAVGRQTERSAMDSREYKWAHLGPNSGKLHFYLRKMDKRYMYSTVLYEYADVLKETVRRDLRGVKNSINR
jgi:hypothetical protein